MALPGLADCTLHESTAQVDGGQMYYRHNGIDLVRPTILFLHGIGESGLCFLEAFHDSRLTEFNIIVPDLIGFGKSSRAEQYGYTFSSQIVRLNSLLNELGVARFNLVGHSMGGMIGTQYCQQHGDRILSFVNIEGDLTSDNRFIVESAIQADANGRFEDWLRDEFARGLIIDICHQWPSTVRYLASLDMCESEAFLESAREIDRIIEPVSDDQTALIGKTYLELKTPRVFCWGSESLSNIARDFLVRTNLNNREFTGAFHWLMLDKTEQFYGFLAEFLASQ